MNRCKIIALLLLVAMFFDSKPVLGCECACSSVKNFDLYHFDVSPTVVTITVDSFSVNDRTNDPIQGSNKKMSVGSSSPESLTSPVYSDIDFDVVVNKIYKGKVSSDRITLRTRDNSCGWIPEIGMTYIIYTSSSIASNGVTYFRVGACNRKISHSSLAFTEEENILNCLSQQSNGMFKFSQSINISDNLVIRTNFSGKFKNKKRVGNWVISETVTNDKRLIKYRNTIFTLKYKNGLLEDIKLNDSNRKKGMNDWRWIESFYRDKI